jgi:long-chain acyl-CoA synthetase
VPTPSTLHELIGVDGARLALDDLARTRSWSELDDRVARWRGLFGELGLHPGDHLAMVMGNRVEFVELVLAALTAGVWLTPVNWHAKQDEIAYVLDDSGASVVFADPEFAASVRAAAGKRPVIEVGRALDDRLARGRPRAPDWRTAPGGNMFYTSGTTGRPKGVRRGRQPDVAGQIASLRRAGTVLGLDGAGPHLVTGPLYHAAPLGFAVMDLLNGAPMIVMPGFDAATTLELIQHRGVRNTHLVPTMFVRLLRLPADVRANFVARPTLRTVLHGAAPIAPSVKREMIEWWGPVLVEYWGASEGGVVTLASSNEWLERPGTVGRAIAHHEVFAVDRDGEVLPAGETGLLWCHNTAVDEVFAYHNDPDKTATAFRGPGVYTIGDIGRVDEDGYVYLADRVSNMIISGGVNIYPAEVEAVLMEHPLVADVAVFGIPDEEWGESVRAAVQPTSPVTDPDGTADVLMAFVRERLASYKAPRSVEFHDRLPRAPTGKLATRVLKEPHWRKDG